jgi:anaerobic ribonucleoside-triphosphate reductase activating protein
MRRCMRIASITTGSYVNGPGKRNVLHVQGCTIGCPGCFNKHTWPSSGGTDVCERVVVHALIQDSPDGITISGGEPMEQWESVSEVIRLVLTEKPELTVLMFTGWTKEHLERSGHLAEMSQISAVVSGPYVEKLACSEPLRGSSNQEIIFLDGRLDNDSLVLLPIVEVHCDGETATITGFPDKSIRQSLMKEL